MPRRAGSCALFLRPAAHTGSAESSAVDEHLLLSCGRGCLAGTPFCSKVITPWYVRQGLMLGGLFRHQKRALAFMLHRERAGVGGPAGGILADDQVCLLSPRHLAV